MKFLMAAAMATGLIHGAAIYNIVDLGPAGGAPPFSGTPLAATGPLWGGSWLTAYASNASGEITGYGETPGGDFRAFVSTPPLGLTFLGTLGGNQSWGMAISDNGQVAGHSTTLSGYIHAFAWSGGPLSDVGTLGGTSSFAYGINDAGYVVGTADAPDSSMHAFLYEGGAMVDLNTLIPTSSGWLLDTAYSIDNSGVIHGIGFRNGQSEKFEMHPAVSPHAVALATPEPSTFLLLGLGLISAGVCRRIKAGVKAGEVRHSAASALGVRRRP